MSRRYVDNLLKYKEKEIDIWGLFVLNGFNQKAVKVHKKSKGSSTYTLKKLKMAIDSITSLSNRPLYYIFVLGVLIIFISMIGIVYILFQKAVYKSEVEGWASILFSLFFIGGLIMFTLGIIGIYLSKIFMEIKNRPLTIIKNVYKS
jgi:putative glycosyltransferase